MRLNLLTNYTLKDEPIYYIDRCNKKNVKPKEITILKYGLGENKEPNQKKTIKNKIK